jgi:DNA-binding PadR family transcriptional regulator
MSPIRTLSPQPALLGFLMTGPKHGYELHQEFSQKLGRVWHLGRSKLYAQLKQLEKVDWVTRQTEPQTNRPPRKMYQLTPGGRQAFLDWLRQPTPKLRRIRIEFLARIFFFQSLSLPGLDELVAAQKSLLQTRIRSLDQGAAETDDHYWQLVLAFRRGQLEAVDHWLDSVIETL